MEAGSVARLDDGQVLLVLSHLTGQLGDQTAVESEDEAREVLAAFLEAFGDTPVDAERVAGPDVAGPEAARALLAAMVDDPDTAPAARELVEHPPDDEQMSVELAIAAAVILGATIGWLQTKIEIEYAVVDGKRTFRFKAEKQATDSGVIKDVVAVVRRALVGK